MNVSCFAIPKHILWGPLRNVHNILRVSVNSLNILYNLNVLATLRRRPKRVLNVLRTFDLRAVSQGVGKNEIIQVFVVRNGAYDKCLNYPICPNPLGNGRKLNVYKVFRRCPEPSGLLCTFNLPPVARSKALSSYTIFEALQSDSIKIGVIKLYWDWGKVG